MYHATVRRVVLVILVLIGIAQAADAQSCAPPVISAPAEICPAAQGAASVPPPSGGAWESVWWSISNGSFNQNGYPSSSAQGLSVTFQPGYTNAPVTLTAFGRDTNGCVTSTSSVQVPLREIDPIVISAPQTSCGGTFMASVLPPADGEWNGVWWTISGGGHFVTGSGYSDIAQGETVTVAATNINPIQLDAFAMDTLGCTSPHGTAQVTFEELDPVVIDAPATSCGGRATASVQPPAEGQWNGIWWTISSNGYFVSEYGSPSQSAQGETVTFVATTTAPLTLSVTTMNESGCQGTGTEQVAFQEMAPVVIDAPDETCPHTPASASVQPPPDGSGSWNGVWWTITNGYFTDPYYGQSTSAQGQNVTFAADSTQPVTLSAFALSNAGCQASQSTAQVSIREIDPVVITAPAQVCPYMPASASVEQPAEGTWESVWWSITNGKFVDQYGSPSTSAQGSTVEFIADTTSPVTLSAFARDSYGCTSPQGTRQVSIREIDPVVITAPAQVCPYMPASASVEQPAEGTWESVWWSITNGKFVDEFGSPSTSAQGSTVAFIADTTSPVTLSAFARDNYGCTSPQGSRNVSIREIDPIVITAPTQVCPYMPASASVEQPAEGTWESVWWSITNGKFVDEFGNQSTSAQGSTVAFIADTTSPVTLSAFARDNYGCTSPQGTRQVSIREIDPVVITAPAQVCPSMPASASVEQPAEGTWESVWWSITNGKFVDEFGNQSTSAQGSTVAFIADTTSPVTLAAFARDNYGCTSPQGTRQVSIREIDPVVIHAPAGLCSLDPVTVTVEPPAEGTWDTLWWSITNGFFVDGSGNTSTSTTGSDPMFVPDGSGNVTLSVFGRDSFGCSSPPASVTVPYSEAPAFLIDVRPQGAEEPGTPGSGSSYDFCGVPVVELTAAGNDPSWTYAWSTGATVPHIEVTEGGTYTLTVTNATGCTSSQSVTVVMNPLPVASISGNLTLCPGGSTTLTAAGGDSYSWSNGATAPSIVAGSAGTYTVTVTANGCSSTTSAVVTDAVPAITAEGPTSFCHGGSVTLTAAPADSYVWSTGATARSIVVTAAGTYTVYSGFGECTLLSDPVVVSVGPISATIASSGTSVCPAQSIGFTSSFTGTGNFTFQWLDSNDAPIPGANGSSLALTPQTPGEGSVTLRVSDANGCSVVSNRIPYTRHDPPKPAIAPSGPTTFCEGGSVTLEASEAQSYLWSTGATTRSITVNASGSYTVTTTGSTGCPVTSDPVVVTVQSRPATPAVTASGPTTFCAGGSVTLTAPSSASYLWSNGATTQSIAVSASGSYSVTVANASGCSAASAATAVVVNAAPATPVVTASGPTTFCAGGSVTLTAPASASYLWSNGATTQSIAVSAAGSSSVTVTNASGCSATSAATNVVVNALPATTITASGPTSFCDGGSVTLTAPASASYLWSTGATTQSIAVSASGSFSVTVTGANGCTAVSAPVTVTENVPVKPTITASATNVCPGGSVTLGSSAAVSYLWSTGATTRSITFAPSGSASYWVETMDANGCTKRSDFITVHVDAQMKPTVSIFGNPAPYCNGETVTLSAPQYIPARTYLWSTGETTRNIQAHAPGTYTVTVTNPTGCSNTSDPVVLNAEVPTAMASGTDAICPGGAATIQADLTGTAPWSITWSDGVTQSGLTASPATRVVSPSATTTYTITAFSDAICTGTKTGFASVTVNPAPAATITAGGPTTFCEGGSVTLTASESASYLWSNGATSRSIVVSASGSYTVTTTNANGCSAASAATSVTANANPVTPVVTASGPTELCPGGSVTLTAPASASYLWSNGATSRSIVVSASGSYGVTVTNASGCSATSAATAVTVNASPTATITPGGPTTFCEGGSVTLSAPAGLSYLWSTGATSQSIVVSASGAYTVTTTNASGCSATSAATSVTVNANPATPVVTASGPVTFCEGGSVTLTAPASTSYLWSNGATTQAIAVSASGSYSVTVTNASGCSATSAATSVTVNANPATPVVTASGPTTFCEGESVTLTAPASASYLWSNGATTQSIVVTASGPYSVTVPNASGCSATSAATNVTVNTLPAATIAASGPATFCEGGSVTLTASESASYLWSNGATTQSIVVSASGSYSVTVTNASGCSATSAATSVTVDANPAQPAISASGPTTFCEGGSVTLTAPASASYLWSTGATTQSIAVNASGAYSVTVANANGCSATSAATSVTVNANPAQPAISASGPTAFCEGGSVTLTAPASASYLWSTGATTQSIAVNASGSYSVTVTNASGCSATSAATSVTVNANPAQPAITPSGPTTFCEGGSVTLTAPASASYLWSNGATSQSIVVNASGSYGVTVTNANGCSATSAATGVTVNANPATPAITPSGPTTFCQGGLVTLTAPASGSYLWSNGATTQSIAVSASGSYSVTVTNAGGCSATSAATAVTVSPNPDTPVISPNGPTTFCEAGSVTLTAMASGSYLWSNGATTQSIVVSTSGSYSVTVTNTNGCSATSAATAVTVNPRPTATITPSGPTTFCQGGSVTLTAPAGLSYVWSNGAMTQSIVVGTSGSYTVSVTNASGCNRTSAPTSVTVNPTPSATITPSGPTTFCEGGSVTLTAPAGLSYAWSTGATTRSITVSASGSYSVTTTSAAGCSATSAPTSVTVNPLPAVPVITPSGPTALCPFASVTLTAPLSTSYLWSNGASTRSITVSTPGSYVVTVWGANGCSRTSAPVSVTANPPTVITTHPLSQTVPRNVTRVLSVVASGTPTLQYQWYNGASGNTSSPIAGATSSALTIGPYTKKGTSQFWVRVTSTGCTSSTVNSNTATITIN